MSEDLFIPWVLQRAAIGTAVLAGLIPALIANLKQRPMLRWYCYGVACTLVAWPLIALPTVHALILRPRTASPEARQRQRRADALALLAESSVRSYPTWIADLRHRSPAGVDRLQGDQAWRVDRAHSRTCQSKQRGGISTPRRSPRLRAEATPLGRASLRRRPSSCRYRRQDQSWWSLSPTRKVRARSNCRP